VPVLATLLGAALGFLAWRTQLCTLGAIADAALCGDSRRACSLVLAMAVAIAGTQALATSGLIEPAESVYLAGGSGWLGAVLGGLCFGFGMALVGTCGFGTLVRLGAGGLRAPIVAYATMSGPLAYLREWVIEAADVPLWAAPGLVGLAAAGLDREQHQLRAVLTALIVALMLVVALKRTNLPPADPARFTGELYRWTTAYHSSRNQGRRRTPIVLPANAAASQTQPCRLPEAMPLKKAPMLQPKASLAP